MPLGCRREVASFTMPPTDGFFTLKELSDWIRLSQSQIRRLAKSGRIPCYQPGGPGGKLLFPRDAIEACAAPQSSSAEQPTPAGPKRLPGRRPKWMAAPDPDTPPQENA